MSTTVGLELEPLDVLFFRDGRPFTPGSRGKSELPMPQTLAGAIWTALLEQYGCDFLALQRLVREEKRDVAAAIHELCAADWLASVHVRGPWLARRQHDHLDVLVPVPAVLYAPKYGGSANGDQLSRLRPLAPNRLPGWTKSLPAEQAGLWPLWHRRTDATEPVSGFLTPDGLRVFLADGEPQKDHVVAAGDLFDFDHRTGIGIHAHRLSAQEGLIYGASFLALKPDVSLYAELVLPDGCQDKTFEGTPTLALGGEGRRVRVSVPAQPFDWPGSERTQDPGQLPLLLLTTPALFADRWRPAAVDSAMRAAAVPGHVAISGWDMARAGPKPMRFAVPAGSVYFLDKAPDAWPPALSDEPEDQRQGWGCYLKGAWTE